MGFIYLIWPREFNVINKNIFKIGKTDTSLKKRFGNYAKGLKLIYYIETNTIVEKDLLKIFKKKYKLVQGREYFEGDSFEMVKDIEKFFNKTLKVFDILEKKDIISFPVLSPIKIY